MVIQPRTVSQIVTDLEQRLDGEINALTNFSDGSFEDDFLTAYAQTIRTTELKALAAELAGYPAYAGKALTADDLDVLGVDTVTPTEINQFMSDSQLDELALQVGVTRDPGALASGEVTITTTADSVQIPEGMEIGTQPDAGGDFLSFFVDADGDGEIDTQSNATASPSAGTTTVTVDVIAGNVGSEYNVGANSLTYVPTPRPGVQSVTNTAATTGGRDRQSTESLRDDVTNALFEAAGGGTAKAIESELQQRFETVTDVEVLEFEQQTPQFIDVVVNGGTQSELTDAIAAIKPAGMNATLKRPIGIDVSVTAQLTGSDIDTVDVQDAVDEYVDTRGIGTRVSQSRLRKAIIEEDSNIISAPAVSTFVDTVTNEIKTYSTGTDVYGLDYAPIGEVNREGVLYASGTTEYSLTVSGIDASTVTLSAIVGNERTTLVRGSNGDYEVIDADNDGKNDAISFTGATLPDNNTTFEVSYAHDAGRVDTVQTEDGTTFTAGTDYSVVDTDADGRDDAIDFGIGGSSPNDGERFEVDYTPRRSFGGDLVVDRRTRVSSRSGLITITTRSL